MSIHEFAHRALWLYQSADEKKKLPNVVILLKIQVTEQAATIAFFRGEITINQVANVDLNSLFWFISHEAELPNNSYSWAPTWQNVLWIYVENVLWIAKNWRENALISLRGIDKTQFPSNAKSYYMFWATSISREMLYLRLKLFFKFLHELSAFENLGTNRPFQRGTCSGFEVKSDFKVSKSGFKKVNDRKEKVWSFC